MTPNQTLEPLVKPSWSRMEIEQPSWTRIEIETVPMNPFIVLVLSICDVCQIWWRKYVRGGRA
ncbi:MAG: hypothetical protein WCB68_17930 [Pyrinomonadaceae bacterium]